MTGTPEDPALIRRNRTFYLGGIASWFATFGIQMVLFPWLVAIELGEPADRVGIAQMALLAPMLIFVLFGGALADRVEARKVVSLCHLFGAVPHLVMAVVIASGELRYEYLIVYGASIGTIGAFLMPARDAMLYRVAAGEVQRMVTMTMAIQFGVQIVGFAIGSFGDQTGAVPLIVAQAVVILIGAPAYWQVRIRRRSEAEKGPPSRVFANIAEGARIVFNSTELRPVMMLNLGQGVFLMASFMVGIPLMIRDVYAGGSFDLGMANVLNMTGITVTTLIMLKMGGFVRQGRAVLTAFFIGGLVLVLIAAGLPYTGMLFVFFCWGMGGGVAIVLGRTIVQEWAPDSHRGQVLAFYNLFFLGGAPIGSLFIGYLALWFGVQPALMIVAAAMTTLTLCIGLFTPMWKLVPPTGELFPEEAETEVIESIVRVD